MSQVHNRTAEVTTLIQSLEQEFNKITTERKEELQLLGDMINAQVERIDSAQVIFVCTHNSRRSQLAEIWLRLASDHYGVNAIHSFSGGTESTAFNHRMVAAIKRAGIKLNTIEQGLNPRYTMVSSKSNEQETDLMFSKKYDHEYNPQKDFIAVMVCTQADQDCPFVPGATERMALPYLDPKSYDDTPQESQAYDDKVREIGREILYLMSHLAT